MTNQVGSPWDAAPPVLLNTWKHHAAALRRRIREASDLSALAAELVVIGNELMDLYLGTLTPAEIGRAIVAELNATNRLAVDAFRAWVQTGGGYQFVDLFDTSRWVLRMGDAGGLYVHVHPGRYAPKTRRVRANVLKTAVLVLASVHLGGGDPLDVKLVNDVRRRYLALAPIGKDLAGDHGLGGVIDVLRSEG